MVCKGRGRLKTEERERGGDKEEDLMKQGQSERKRGREGAGVEEKRRGEKVTS